MDVIDRIKDQLTSHSVLLYMKGTPDFPQCGFSARKLRLNHARSLKPFWRAGRTRSTAILSILDWF